MRNLKVNLLAITGVCLLFTGTALGQTPPTFCATTPAGLSEEAKADLQAQCAAIYNEYAKAALQKAKIDAKSAGLTTTIANAPTGKVTEINAANDKYPTIFAAAALSYAGNEVGQRICHQARMAGAPKLVVGLPSDYRRAQTQKSKIKSDADLIKLRINNKAETFRTLKITAEKRVAELRTSTLTLAGKADNEKDNNTSSVETASENKLISDVAVAGNVITGVANVVNNVANLFQSDVTITPVAVNLSDKTLMSAIKRGILQNNCPVMTPEFTSKSIDPFPNEKNQMEIALTSLKVAATNLISYVESQLPPLEGLDEAKRTKILADFAKFKLDTQNTVRSSEDQAQTFWNGLYTNEVVQVTDSTTNKATEVILPSLIEDINISEAALSGGNKHFIGAKVVTSAATHIQSKGLFRSDRLHYTGSVVIEYEVVDQYGITQMSGLYDASIAELVRDDEGFIPRIGIVDNPGNLLPNKNNIPNSLASATNSKMSVYTYESR